MQGYKQLAPFYRELGTRKEFDDSHSRVTKLVSNNNQTQHTLSTHKSHYAKFIESALGQTQDTPLCGILER